MKSYDVTIQMKALCLYFHTMLFVFEKISRGEMWTFGRNLLLIKFGSERVKETKWTGLLARIRALFLKKL